MGYSPELWLTNLCLTKQVPPAPHDFDISLSDARITLRL